MKYEMRPPIRTVEPVNTRVDGGSLIVEIRPTNLHNGEPSLDCLASARMDGRGCVEHRVACYMRRLNLHNGESSLDCLALARTDAGA